MNSATETLRLQGESGVIEALLDTPAQAAVHGTAVIAHPHPLFGGTMQNKVVQTLARAFVQCGWQAVRFNFRGVGASEGTHDHGIGETDDFLYLIANTREWLGADAPTADAPRALAGLSFGSFVAARAARTLAAQHQPVRHLVLVGSAAGKWDMPDIRRDTLVIHGELDDTIALSAVLDWLRPQDIPVVVLPGADHFFHRRLGALKQLVIRHVLGAEAMAATAGSTAEPIDG